MNEILLEKIESAKAKVAVIGLGFVGISLAKLIHGAGYSVEGIDKYVLEYPVELEGLERFRLHEDFSVIRHCDVIALCVPTPLSEHQTPDLSYLEDAVREISRNFDSDRGEAARPKLMVIESTSFPGTTREVVLPLLEEMGLSTGSDFYLAYAPERVDPGRDIASLSELPRVVGGLDPVAGELAEAFYSKLVRSVHRVSTPEVAEMSKLLENVFRAVNIALVNELSLLCDRMDIDIWEVIDAAATKPFGFMPFRPGPGLGGHCIPIDPFYLAWKAKEYDFHTEFIELAGKINVGMPYFVLERIARALNGDGKSVKGARVLVVGVAYKEDVSDIRESPGIKVIKLLKEGGAEVSFHDDLVGEYTLEGDRLASVPLDEAMMESYDCIVIITPHSYLDFGMFRDLRVPVVDTRGVLRDTGW